MNTLPKGTYRHYKGHLYEVIGVARHSETLEDMVVYKALCGDFGLWVRPLTMFLEDVEVNGKLQKRFEPVQKGGVYEAATPAAVRARNLGKQAT
jgi:hypothetical protein